MKHTLILICLFLTFLAQSNAQERAWISNKSSIILRDDMRGFNKINDSTYQMIGINEPCIESDSSKSIIIDGVGTFSSMPCFRDYLLKQPNKIIVWGKLSIAGDIDTTTVYNWQNDVLEYSGSRWSGAFSKLPPYTGCKCSFSNGVGDSVKLNFYGNGIKIWGELNSHLNTADVYIDGIKVGQIDEYDSVGFGNDQFIMYENMNLSDGNHVLKIVVTGENEQSSGKYFVLHKIEVFNEDKAISPIVNNVDTVYIHTTDTVFLPSDTVVKRLYYMPTAIENEGQIQWDWQIIEK